MMTQENQIGKKPRGAFNLVILKINSKSTMKELKFVQ